jgi:transposase-like protein
MNATKEVIIPRVHCPHCGEAGHRIYKTIAGETRRDDTVRYARCTTCGKSFRITETNNFGMFHSVVSGNFPQTFNK